MRLASIKWKMKTFQTAVLLLLCTATAVACDSGKAPYPSDRSVYPSDKGLAFQTPNIRFGSATGAITSRLMNSSTGLPASGVTVHLAKLLPLSPGPGHLITLELANTPHAITTADGGLLFEDIEPGEYALLVWTPHDTRQVEYSDAPERELIAVVEAGKVTDLGVLKVVVP